MTSLVVSSVFGRGVGVIRFGVLYLRGGRGVGEMGLVGLYLPGGGVGVMKVAGWSSGEGGVGVMRISGFSLRGGGLGVTGLAVPYLRGGCVGETRVPAFSLRRGGVGEMGVGVSNLRGRGVGLRLSVLYRGGAVGVMRYGVLSIRCGRGTGVKLAPLSLRGDRDVAVGLANSSPRDAGSR